MSNFGILRNIHSHSGLVFIKSFDKIHIKFTLFISIHQCPKIIQFIIYIQFILKNLFLKRSVLHFGHSELLLRRRLGEASQLVTRNVNLSFVGVWVIFFDVLPVAK